MYVTKRVPKGTLFFLKQIFISMAELAIVAVVCLTGGFLSFLGYLSYLAHSNNSKNLKNDYLISERQITCSQGHACGASERCGIRDTFMEKEIATEQENNSASKDKANISKIIRINGVRKMRILKSER